MGGIRPPFTSSWCRQAWVTEVREAELVTIIREELDSYEPTRLPAYFRPRPRPRRRQVAWKKFVVQTVPWRMKLKS